MEGAAKETAHEALPSSLVAVSETEDHIDRSNFCIKMQDAMTEEGFLDRVVFSDESTFHISGRVHRLKILTRWCNMKGLPQRSMFFAQCPHERFMGLSFSVKTL